MEKLTEINTFRVRITIVSDLGFKGTVDTVVHQALPFLHRGSLIITLTVLLNDFSLYNTEQIHDFRRRAK